MANHKPLSSKKPPQPQDDHQLIAAWIVGARPALEPILSQLDEQIVRQLNSPRYAIKWGKAFYGSARLGWCIEVVAYDVSVNVVFLNGPQLPNPPTEGDEKRYVKLKTLADAQSEQLHEWIRQSCRTHGWGW